ncbi:MAG: hypothetical protein ING36_03515 [Burkholderiales bacterium]|nr:hypothetical protein [Burkholderiales bacterium]
MQPMDINDTNATNESIPLEPLENPLYQDVSNNIENPLYSNDIKQESIYNKPIMNTTMSYIKSINDDLSLVNYWDNVSKSAASGLAPMAAEQAQKTRQELEEIYRTSLTDFARQGALDSVNRSLEQLQAVRADINTQEPSTYLDVKESAQKASESVLMLQELSKKTGKSPEELYTLAKQFSKNLAIRSTLENFLNTLEERSLPVQFLQEVIPLQTGEDILFLLPAINKKLQDFGFTESVLTNASAQNSIQQLLRDLPENDAVQFLYDLKDSLVDAVDQKDARKFLATLLEERKTTSDIAVESVFRAIDVVSVVEIASLIRGIIRGGAKMVSPSKAAIATGNADAAAADVASTIAKGKPSILGHPEPLDEASALNPSILPNAYHQLSRNVQDKLRQAYEEIDKALRTALPTSGVNKSDVLRTTEALKTRFDPTTNKSIRAADITPDLDKMRVGLSVTYDNKGILFDTKEAAEEAYKGKLVGQVTVVEMSQQTEDVVKTLKQDLKRQMADLEKSGVAVLSKGEAKPVKPVSNMDAVPVSKQSRVENLNDVIQTSKADTGAIAATIKALTKKDPETAKALEQKWIELRKAVKEAKLDTTDGAKLVKVLNTPVEEAAKDFQTALSAAESKAKPRIKATAITPEIQSKLLTLEETARMLEEAKAGRYLPKGYVVKQQYDHPVFSDNNLAKLTEEELNATHGAFLSALNPALGAASSFYNVRLMEVYKQSKLGKAWVNYFKKMPSLSGAERKQVTEALVKSDALEHEFDPLELKAQFDIESEEAITAYYLFRQSRNMLHTGKDGEAVDDLIARGFREAKVSVPGTDAESTIESFVVKQITDATPLYDKRAYHMTTGKGTTINPESLAHGAQVLEVRGGYLAGKTNYDYIIVEPTKVRVHDITSVVGKKEGTFSRIHTDEFFITERIPIDGDGAVKEGRRALRTATTIVEADKYVAGMNALQAMAKAGVRISKDDVIKHLGDFETKLDDMADAFNSGKYNDSIFERNVSGVRDVFFRNLIYRGGYDVSTGKLFFSRRGDKAIPSISQKSIEANVADPWTSIQREITNTINFVSATEMRRNMIQKWYNTFKDLIPADMIGKDAEQTFANAVNRLDQFKKLRGYETTREKQMIGQLKFVLNSIGVEHPVERITRAAIHSVMNNIEKGLGATKFANVPVIKHIPAMMRQWDVPNFARYLTSHAFLGLGSVRQLWVQSSGMLYTAALHPVHGSKAAFNIVPLLTAYGSDNPEVWKWALRAADPKDIAVSSNDFVRTVAAMKRIGLLDNIGASTVNEGADAAANVLGKAKQRFDATSFFLFNSGEAVNRVGAFDTARRVWSEANPGLVWDSTENLPKVLELADTFNGNMTRASEAFWQKGVLSIPTQFLQYGVKSSANLLAACKSTVTGKKMRGLTSKEMLSVLIATPFIYGMDNTGVESIYKEWLGEEIANLSDEEKLYIGQGIISGVINSATKATTGQEAQLAIGTMTSPFTFSRDLTEAAVDGTFELSTLGGPFGSWLQNVYNIWPHSVVLWEKEEVTSADVVKTIAQISSETTQTGRALWKTYLMGTNGGLNFDTQGQLLDVQSSLEVAAKGAGFTLYSEVTKNALFKNDKEYRAAMKDIADTVKFLKKKQFQLQPDDPLAQELQRQINVVMNRMEPADRRVVERQIREDKDYRTQVQSYIERNFAEPTQRRMPSEQIGAPAYPFPTKGNE